jgi:Ca2+-binding EF-hand superfamily protein
MSEEACLIKMFKYFDVYNREAVNFQDFYKAMEKIGLYYTEQELLPLFNLYDLNGNSEIDFKEFSAIIFGGEAPKGQMTKKAPISHDQVNTLVEAFRKKIVQRGARGIVGLQRIFKIMDDDGSKSLNRMEFDKACRDFKVDITTQDLGVLFQAFDLNRDGTVQYDEFLRMIRGDLTPFRLRMVEAAFKKLDRDGSGVVEA